MSNSEKLLLAITVVMTGEIVNLYITDKRIVGLSKATISKGKSVKVGTLMGGAVGKGITYALESKKQKEKATEELNAQLNVSSFDELLKKDENNFEILFSEVNWIQVNKSWIGNSLAVETADDKGAFQINKEQAEQLSQILPTISLLDGKIK